MIRRAKHILHILAHCALFPRLRAALHLDILQNCQLHFIQLQLTISKLASMPPLGRLDFVKSVTQKLRLTHYICLPVLTELSRPQFRDSFSHLLNHPSAAAFPTGAVRPLGTLHLSVGTLRLGSPRREAAAIKLLDNLQVHDILKDCSVGLTDLESEELRFQAARSAPDIAFSPAKATPLSVILSGLWCRPGHEADAYRLSIKASDPTRRLGSFIDKIRYAFIEAGMLVDYPRNCSRDFPPDEQPICVICIQSLGPVVHSKRHPTKVKTTHPKIDAKSLLEQYKDEVWVEGARLGRLSICKMGLAKEIKRAGGNVDPQMGLHEISSVPLP